MPHLHRAKAVAPRFCVADLGGGEAEITLYGDVVQDEPVNPFTGERDSGLYITAESFNAELAKIKTASHVTVHLNSGGGDLYTGIAIYNALKALDADVTVRIEGLAASAASVIACAGTEVIATPASIFMVHQGYLGLCGWYTPADLDVLKKDAMAGVKAMENVYVSKTKRDPEEVSAMVAEETWLAGQEIVDAGFADVLETGEDSTEPETEEDGSLIVAGIRHDMSAYRNAPRFGAAANLKETTVAEADVDSKEPHNEAEKKGETFMDVTELRAAHPDLVAEIEASAAQAERERISAIDEIADSIAPDMVAAAKYGETKMTAEQLAFAALKAQREQAAADKVADRTAAAEYMAAVEDDKEESGTDDVEADPDSTDEDKDKEQAAADIKAAVEMLRNKGGQL